MFTRKLPFARMQQTAAKSRIADVETFNRKSIWSPSGKTCRNPESKTTRGVQIVAAAAAALIAL